jgi:hypothetical protein
MGWKASCVFVNWGRQDYFETFPEIDVHRTQEVLQRLGYSGYDAAGTEVLETAIYPRNGAIYAGAFAEGFILAEDHMPAWLIAQDKSDKISGRSIGTQQFAHRLLELYPKARICSLVLHSVVNLWGFSWYENGKLLRTSWGAADNGLVLDYGAPLPEELQFRLQPDLMDNIGSEGEELCFAVAERILGQRLDKFSLENITLLHFVPMKMKRRLWPFSIFSTKN